MSGHAILSPSAAYRWSVCTPSARFEEQIPETDTFYAEEGDLAHELAAFLLKHSLDPYKEINHRAILSKLKYDIDRFYEKNGRDSEYETMREYCEGWVRYVHAFNTYDHYAIEERIDLSGRYPLGFGRGDFIGYNKEKKVIFVFDFKYGAGVAVKIQNNPQLMLYGLGALDHFEKLNLKIEKVVTGAHQPRVNGGGGACTYNPQTLRDWAEILKPLAELAIAGQGEFISGDHCQFCKAKTVCRAYFTRFETLLAIQDQREITDEDRETIVEYGAGLTKYIDDIKAQLLKRIINGEKVEGFRVIQGTKKRSFKSEDAVIEALIAEDIDGLVYSVLPLTKLEDKLGKKRFSEVFGDIIVTKEGGPRLVKSTEAGADFVRASADDYDDEDDE